MKESDSGAVRTLTGDLVDQFSPRGGHFVQRFRYIGDTQGQMMQSWSVPREELADWGVLPGRLQQFDDGIPECQFGQPYALLGDLVYSHELQSQQCPLREDSFYGWDGYPYVVYPPLSPSPPLPLNSLPR